MRNEHFEKTFLDERLGIQFVIDLTNPTCHISYKFYWKKFQLKKK